MVGPYWLHHSMTAGPLQILANITSSTSSLCRNYFLPVMTSHLLAVVQASHQSCQCLYKTMSDGFKYQTNHIHVMTSHILVVQVSHQSYSCHDKPCAAGSRPVSHQSHSCHDKLCTVGSMPVSYQSHSYHDNSCTCDSGVAPITLMS